VNAHSDAGRVLETLRSYGIAVDEHIAAELAAEARDHSAAMQRLLAYDLTGVGSAVELTRRGRR
jgi:hypothetical protein